MLIMFLSVFIATLVASSIGATISVLVNKLHKEIVNFLQAFSSGAILGLCFIEILPESLELFNEYTNNYLGILYSTLFIFGTGLLFFILHELMHYFSHHHHDDKDDLEPCDDHLHSTEFIKKDKSLLISSFIFLITISIHNVPEGLALGLSLVDTNSNIPIQGIIMAAVIFIHNIIVSFSMCQSFKNSGKSNLFSISLTISATLPSVIFAICGYFVSSFFIDTLTQAILLSISAGSLLFVLFIELIPQVFIKYKSKLTVLYLVLGILITILLLFIA